MGKKPYLYVSLVISIIALIYMCLSYYGIIRYVKVHIVSSENYINTYLKKNKPEKRTIIHTSISSEEELKKIKVLVNSLLDQEIRVDEIAISLPSKYNDKVPENLKKILNLYGQYIDYGNAQKLIPVLLREKDADTNIIIVEPNIVYSKDFIQDVIDMSTENPQKIIRGKDFMVIRPEFFSGEIVDEKNVTESVKESVNSVIERCCGVSYENVSMPGNYKIL